MAKKINKRIEQGVDGNNVRNMSSDLLADIIHSFATDLLKGLYKDGNIQDVERAIATVNAVTKEISLDGIKLRKANIERRTNARKQSIDDTPTVVKEDVRWKKYRGDKKLEYTTDININNKYPLKKRKEDVVVGLLTEDQLDGEHDIKYKMSSKEKEKLFMMGFVPDVKYGRE